MRSEEPEPEVGSLADELAGLFSALHDVDTHSESGDCRYCPVCRAMAVARSTSPEVREHLVSAGVSLLKAVAGLLDTTPPRPRPEDGPEDGPDDRDGSDGDAVDDEGERQR